MKQILLILINQDFISQIRLPIIITNPKNINKKNKRKRNKNKNKEILPILSHAIRKEERKKDKNRGKL